jgi:hypothetical protein
MDHATGKKKAAKKGETAEIPPNVQDLHCFTETNGVITTTMFDVPGYRVVKVLGAVYGLTVRSRNWAAGFGMVMKSIAGGELQWFTSMVSKRIILCPPIKSYSRPPRYSLAGPVAVIMT